MASEYTSHYNLDKYVATDKPNLRDQYNSAMDKIDAQMFADNTLANTALNTANTVVKDLSTEVTRAKTAESTLQTNIDTVESDLAQSISDTADNITSAYKAADASITSAYKAADASITSAYKAADASITSELKEVHEIVTDHETLISNNTSEINSLKNNTTSTTTTLENNGLGTTLILNTFTTSVAGLQVTQSYRGGTAVLTLVKTAASYTLAAGETTLCTLQNYLPKGQFAVSCYIDSEIFLYVNAAGRVWINNARNASASITNTGQIIWNSLPA